MLGWLPIIGPVIDGVISIIKGAQDTTLGKYREDTSRTATETKADVEIIQARAQVAIAFKDEIGSRLARDLFMFPAAMYAALKYAEAIVGNLIPMWHIGDIPSTLQYTSAAIVAFLFVTSYRK